MNDLLEYSAQVRGALRRPGGANADFVTDRAIHWLRGRQGEDAPFFLWLHYYDPHTPYEVPDGGTTFGDEPIDRYDAEIAFVDQHIGRLLEALDDQGLASTTIIAVTADHGEEFYEHGQRYHARSLFNQVIRIPLIVRHPGSPPRTIDTPVSLVDVMPTLLDLAGVESPPSMNGQSLAPAIRGQSDPPSRPILLEVLPDQQIHRDMAGLILPPWKILSDRILTTCVVKLPP